jgi:hypothetical protein
MRYVVAHAVLACTVLGGSAFGQGLVIDHHDTNLTAYSQADFQLAKDQLHIAYGHTSHGSQVTTGMTGMVGFINGEGLGLSYPTNFFAYNSGGTGGALDLRDTPFSGANDLGAPNYTAWATATRNYLDDPANSAVNVIMWSWCGQADTTAANIDLYLSLMTQLEVDYPDVNFVYMTGHVNGGAPGSNLLLRNQQIRDYVIANDKVLYDFADIESWDPDGNYYGDKLVLDDCSYDSDGNGSRDKNWATDWQASHTVGVDWYSCSSAHSQPLNANRKAYAAWAMFAQLVAAPTPGDYNSDGAVDAADYTVWRDGLGTTYTEADYDVWRTHFGEMAGSGAGANCGAVAVPEPASIALAFIGAVALVGLCRRRRA